ncbi:MAG: hypothetical protein MZV63_19155 [Marinilabiliales bacterium]|nr:hypothetical protein [Marinilabiliales bacterium]
MKKLKNQNQLVEEPKVEVQPEVVKEPEPIEVAKPKPAVNIEIASTDKKSYSVQIMALKKAVDIDYFSNLQNVVITLTPDGFYRYTVGNTVSYAEVTALKEKIQQLGYPTAFVKINPYIPNYTIQLMALKAPVDLSFFKELPIVSVTKGADDFYRYTFGAYESVSKSKRRSSEA